MALHGAFVDTSVHPVAGDYYRRFNWEPRAGGELTEVGQVVEMPSMTMAALLQKILDRALRQGRVVTVHHGTVEGMAIPLIAGAAMTASLEALNLLRLDRSASEVSRLLRISEGHVVTLRQLMRAVQDLHLVDVIIRGCNIGLWENTLEAIRRFFGAQCACAPKVRDAFGRVGVHIVPPGSPAWQTFAGHPRTQAFQTGNGQVLLRTLLAGATHFTPEVYAESQTALRDWIVEQLPTLSPARALEQPVLIHGQLTASSFVLPKQRRYTENLFAVRG